MLRNAKIKYLVVRTHGLSSHLIDPSELRSWIFIEDDRALFDKISQTSYGGFFEKPEDLSDPVKIEEVTMRVNFIRANKLISIARASPLENILRVYMSKYDLENIRRIVFSLLFGRLERVSLLPHPGYLYDTAKLSKAERLEDLLDLIEERKLSSLVSNWLSGDRNISELDLILTKAYIDSLIGPLKRGTPLYEIIRSYLENMTLGLLLKAKYLRISNDLIIRALSGVPFKKLLEAVNQSGDLSDFLDKLLNIAPYREVSIEVRDSLRDVGEPWVIEHSVLKRAYTEAVRISMMSPMSEAYIISYLISSEWESQSLRTVLFGRISGVSKYILYQLLSPKGE
jgi:vacuolar-type H+-ATPase subunit C/Vma6